MKWYTKMMKQETFLWQYNIKNYSFYDSEQWTRKSTLFIGPENDVAFYLDVQSAHN